MTDLAIVLALLLGVGIAYWWITLLGAAALIAILGQGSEDLTIFGWIVGILVGLASLSGVGFVFLIINFVLIMSWTKNGEEGLIKTMRSWGIYK